MQADYLIVFDFVDPKAGLFHFVRKFPALEDAVFAATFMMAQFSIENNKVFIHLNTEYSDPIGVVVNGKYERISRK